MTYLIEVVVIVDAHRLPLQFTIPNHLYLEEHWFENLTLLDLRRVVALLHLAAVIAMVSIHREDHTIIALVVIVVTTRIALPRRCARIGCTWRIHLFPAVVTQIPAAETCCLGVRLAGRRRMRDLPARNTRASMQFIRRCDPHATQVQTDTTTVVIGSVVGVTIIIHR